MTAAKIMDIISRLPGCDGQAADAVSAFTQVKIEDAHKLLKIPQSEFPDIWIRLPRHKWPKLWSSMEDPVVPLERNLYGHPSAGPLWERQFEKILLKYGWEKVSTWECLFVHREKVLFWSMYVDDIKLAGKKQNLDPMWKVLNKEVDLGQPTSFLDHVFLGCTQRPCETCKDIVDNYRTMFESRISAGATEKQPNSEQLSVSVWSYDIEGHAKKCVRNIFGSWRTTLQFHKVSTSRIDDHHFKEKELKYLGELSKVCSQIILKCLYLAHVRRPDILWSVKKTCTIHHKMDQSLWQTPESIDLIHLNTNSNVMWVTLQNNADWDCFKTPIWQEIWRIQNLHQVEYCAFFGCHAFCSNQLDV